MNESIWIALMCGPTGSGKSTFAARLCQSHGCLVVSTDSQRMAMFSGRYPAKPLWAESRALIYDVVDDIVRSSLGHGFPVVVDGVNLTPQDRMRYLRHFPSNRCAIICFDSSFDNDAVWEGRGYNSSDAAKIRELHKMQFVEPQADEAQFVYRVRSGADMESLIQAWPFRRR